MHPAKILRHPIITEKGTMMADQKKVLFSVDKTANKRQIKTAVEEMYKVKVVKVNTAIRRGKLKRVRTEPGYQPNRKRAVVTLSADSKIDLL